MLSNCKSYRTATVGIRKGAYVIFTKYTTTHLIVTYFSVSL